MKIDTFWKWLLKGSAGSAPGWRNVINLFLIFHAAVGLIVGLLLKQNAYVVARTALFPAASILVGLSLAWTTRASAALQNEELRKTLIKDSRPAEDYVYGYQMAILMIVLMVVYVSIMAAGGTVFKLFGGKTDEFFSGFWMYVLISIALRECWGVVSFTNMLTLLDYRRSK